MATYIQNKMDLMDDFCVPEILQDTILWDGTEIEIDHQVRDVIMSWLETCELAEEGEI